MESTLDGISFHISELSGVVADFKNRLLDYSDDLADIRSNLDFLMEKIEYTQRVVQKADLDKNLERRIEWLLADITELRAIHVEQPPQLDFTRIE